MPASDSEDKILFISISSDAILRENQFHPNANDLSMLYGFLKIMFKTCIVEEYLKNK